MLVVGCSMLVVTSFLKMARILIIEDETPMRTALKDVLEARRLSRVHSR
jgi:DNA-binding NtrC family response regulator